MDVNMTPDLPVPAGATADPWSEHTTISDDCVRGLIWTRHYTAKIGVAVDGWQTATGTITATRDNDLAAALKPTKVAPVKPRAGQAQR